MKSGIESQRKAFILMALTSIGLLPILGFAQSKPIMTVDLLQTLLPGEPWDRCVYSLTKTVLFQQVASGRTDSTTIQKITMRYFTSADCSATSGTSVPTYTTPDGTSFTISVGTLFGLVAESAWNVGNSKVSPAVADMAAIQSIAVTFKSTNNNTPQASFTGISFACVPVSCAGGVCTSGSAKKLFRLKTTTAVGDPADGGIIGCQDTGTSPNSFNLVVPASDQNSGAQIVWATTSGGASTLLGATAQSNTDGATNTTVIVNCFSNGTCPVGVTVPTQTAVTNYAAGVCSTYSANGGFTSGWFLPSGSVTNSQLNCIFNNQGAIATASAAAGGAGFAVSTYWSSTEASSTNAWRLNFADATQLSIAKNASRLIRCSRTFTP